MNDRTVFYLVNVDVDVDAADRAGDVCGPEEDVEGHALVGAPWEQNIVAISNL